MRAFVTGGTGLLGNNLVRALLAEGHSVRALVRSRTKAHLLDGLDVELVEGDMGAVPEFSAALDGVDVLFHTAAYFREYYGPPADHWTRLKTLRDCVAWTRAQTSERTPSRAASTLPSPSR